MPLTLPHLMRTSLNSKTLLYPQTVYIIGTYDEDGTPNAMNAAWGGIMGEDKVSICIDRGHLTTANFKRTGAFTVSPATVDTAVAADYVGIVSGKDVHDKVAKAGFHATKASKVDAPLFEELPLAAECEVVSYDEETEILIGRIVEIVAEESILTDGKVDPAKLRPIAYDPGMHGYYSMTERVGNAFQDGNRLKNRSRSLRCLCIGERPSICGSGDGLSAIPSIALITDKLGWKPSDELRGILRDSIGGDIPVHRHRGHHMADARKTGAPSARSDCMDRRLRASIRRQLRLSRPPVRDRGASAARKHPHQRHRDHRPDLHDVVHRGMDGHDSDLPQRDPLVEADGLPRVLVDMHNRPGRNRCRLFPGDRHRVHAGPPQGRRPHPHGHGRRRLRPIGVRPSEEDEGDDRQDGRQDGRIPAHPYSDIRSDHRGAVHEDLFRQLHAPGHVRHPGDMHPHRDLPIPSDETHQRQHKHQRIPPRARCGPRDTGVRPGLAGFRCGTRRRCGDDTGQGRGWGLLQHRGHGRRKDGHRHRRRLRQGHTRGHVHDESENPDRREARRRQGAGGMPHGSERGADARQLVVHVRDRSDCGA